MTDVSYTFEQLKDMVLEHQFSETKYDTFAGQMLNEAQQIIARRLRGTSRTFFTTQTVNTVAGTNTVALDATFGKAYSMTETSTGTPIYPASLQDFDDLPVTGSSGKPTYYTIDRTNIKFYPIPDAVYTFQFRYYRQPAEMTASQGPEIPGAYQNLLVTYALARCYRRENDYRASQEHMAEFERDLGRMQADLQDDIQDQTQPDQVEGMWSGEGAVIRAFIP